jgi:hypothetical protein
MGRFSDVTKGTRARLQNVRFHDIDGAEHACEFVVVSGDDDATIIERAGVVAKEKGFSAKRGDALFDFQCSVELVALASVDAASTVEKPIAYFDGGAAQVRAKLDRDTIHFLAAKQMAFQERTSPLQHELDDAQFNRKLSEIAASVEGDDSPFDSLGSSLLRGFTRTLARRHVILLRFSSSGSSAPSSQPSKPSPDGSSSSGSGS